jgi:hypothetical protein
MNANEATRARMHCAAAPRACVFGGEQDAQEQQCRAHDAHCGQKRRGGRIGLPATSAAVTDGLDGDVARTDASKIAAPERPGVTRRAFTAQQRGLHARVEAARGRCQAAALPQF